jgi:hypothetical protein
VYEDGRAQDVDEDWLFVVVGVVLRVLLELEEEVVVTPEHGRHCE